MCTRSRSAAATRRRGSASNWAMRCCRWCSRAGWPTKRGVSLNGPARLVRFLLGLGCNALTAPLLISPTVIKLPAPNYCVMREGAVPPREIDFSLWFSVSLIGCRCVCVKKPKETSSLLKKRSGLVQKVPKSYTRKATAGLFLFRFTNKRIRGEGRTIRAMDLPQFDC